LPDPDKEDEYHVAQEPEPDNTPGYAISVDLGENVAEDVAEGKDQYGGRQQKRAEADNLNGDNVCGDKAGDKNGGDYHQAV
jgi:hypothetical protein